MASLFEYTGTQGIVNPNSPMVQGVKPTNPMANITNIMSTLQTAQYNNLVQENKFLAQQIEVAKADKSKADTLSFLKSDEALSLMWQDYADSITNAGNDLQKHEDITTKFINESTSLMNSQNQDVQLKMQASFQAMRQKAQSTFKTTIFKDAGEKFLTSIDTSMPAMMAQNPEDFKVNYDNYLRIGETLGISRRDLGDRISKNIFAHTVKDINAEQVVANRDYSQVAKLSDAVAQIRAVDPNNTKLANEYQTKVNSLKNLVDSGLVSDVKVAIDNLNSDKFQGLIQNGVMNGAFTEDQAHEFRTDFMQKMESSGELAKLNFEALWKATNGVFSEANIKDPKVLKLWKAKTTSIIQAEASSDKPVNLAYMNEIHTKNPATYNAALKPVLDSAINQVLSDMTNNPNNLRASLDTLNKLKSMGFTDIDPTTSAHILIATSLANSPTEITNKKKVIEILKNNPDKMNLIPSNDKQVKAILNSTEIPPEYKTQARGLYSALVGTGEYNETQALDIVNSSYKYHAFDKNDVKYSNTLKSDLQKAGVTEKGFQYLIPTLLSTDIFPPEVSDKVQTLLQKGDATVSMLNGYLYLSNKEDTYSIPMSGTMVDPQDATKEVPRMAVLARAMNDKYILENPPSKFQRAVDSIMNKIGDTAFGKVNQERVKKYDIVSRVQENRGGFLDNLITSLSKEKESWGNYQTQIVNKPETLPQANADLAKQTKINLKELFKGTTVLSERQKNTLLRQADEINTTAQDADKPFKLQSLLSDARNTIADSSNNPLLSYLKKTEGDTMHTDIVGNKTAPFGINTDIWEANIATYMANNNIKSVTDMAKADWGELASDIWTGMKSSIVKTSKGSQLPDNLVNLATAYKYNTGVTNNTLLNALFQYTVNNTEENLGNIISASRRTAKGKFEEGLDNRAVKDLIAFEVIDISNPAHKALLDKFLPLWKQSKI